LYINKKSEALKLIQQARNEAHRFAITFHRQLRSKSFLRTELTDIPGVGEKTAAKLLQHFNSVKKMREAGEDAWKTVVGASVARQMATYFFGENVGEEE
jgi:excinuclease ABC subunit C